MKCARDGKQILIGQITIHRKENGKNPGDTEQGEKRSRSLWNKTNQVRFYVQLCVIRDSYFTRIVAHVACSVCFKRGKIALQWNQVLALLLNANVQSCWDLNLPEDQERHSDVKYYNTKQGAIKCPNEIARSVDPAIRFCPIVVPGHQRAHHNNKRDTCQKVNYK